MQNELRALQNLQDSSLAPQLYFVIKRGEHFFIGMEALFGKTLADGVTIWSQQERRAIAKATLDALKTLHEQFQYTHLDLNPKNIMADKQNSREHFAIKLLDWEMSSCLNSNSLASFETRGTAGFSSGDAEYSLKEKDISALNACLKFLVPEGLQTVPPPKLEKYRWTKWI